MDRGCPPATYFIIIARELSVQIIALGLKEPLRSLYTPPVSIDDHIYSGWTSQGMDLPYLLLIYIFGMDFPRAWTCLTYLYCNKFTWTWILSVSFAFGDILAHGWIDLIRY